MRARYAVPERRRNGHRTASDRRGGTPLPRRRAGHRNGGGTMKHASLTLPEIAAVAATRAAGGAGLALLLGDRLAPERRRTLGWTLLAIGVLTTLPLVLDVRHKLRDAED
jgi:hypothetical protein